jgi:hypothetical protein
MNPFPSLPAKLAEDAGFGIQGNQRHSGTKDRVPQQCTTLGAVAFCEVRAGVIVNPT